MKKIVLVTCVAPKRKYKCAAKDLYQGPLFKQLMQFATTKNPDKIFILSGKHHLLTLDTEIEPYDVNLNNVSEEDLIDWSNTVITQLINADCNLQKDYFYILTNETYRKHLIPSVKHFEVPFYIE